ncbi:MAG: hypothetical protein R3Y22_02670 [Bacteroidales bacterium]
MNNLYHKKIRKIAAYFTLLIMSLIFIIGYGAEPLEDTTLKHFIIFKLGVTLILLLLFLFLKRTNLLKELE